MAGSAAVGVSGLHELDRAFRRMDKQLRKDFVGELKTAAAPVKEATTSTLLSELRNLPRTPHYAGMRIGVSARETTVYIVPSWRARGSGSGRAAFGESIRRRMDRAVDEHESDVVKGIEDMIDRMADTWGRGG